MLDLEGERKVDRPLWTFYSEDIGCKFRALSKLVENRVSNFPTKRSSLVERVRAKFRHRQDRR